jgi:hypothetical protein
MKMLASGTALLITFSSSLWVQWPKYKEPGEPRDAQGPVLMEASGGDPCRRAKP